MVGSCQNKEYNSSPVWFISKVLGLALFTTSPSKRKLYLNIAYTGAYCAVYLVFFALSVKYNPLTHKNYPVICIVGKTTVHISHPLTQSFNLISGNYMHTYIAFYVCLQSYLLSLKKGSFLNQFFWRIKAVDDKLAEILEKKHDFFSDARRWQYFGVILTMILFAALAVFDFITFHRWVSHLHFDSQLTSCFPQVVRTHDSRHLLLLHFPVFHIDRRHIAVHQRREINSIEIQMHKRVSESHVI